MCPDNSLLKFHPIERKNIEEGIDGTNIMIFFFYNYAVVRHGVLAKFNYVRPDYNIMHYGEIFPPIYNLSNIPHDLPLFISYGGQDALSDVRDVENLLDRLKFHDVDKRSIQFVKDYAHADYIMGFNAKDIVYNSVLSFFNQVL